MPSLDLIIYVQQGVAPQVYTDADTTRFALTPSATEAKEAVDSGTETLLLTPSSVEVYGATVFLYLTVSGVEVINVDTGTEYLALTPSSVEVKVSVDAANPQVKFTPATSVEIQLGETIGTVYFLLLPIQFLFDENEVRLTLTALGTDAVSIQTTDNDTALVTFTPSGTDFLAKEYVDADTLYLDLTATGVDLHEPPAIRDDATLYFALTPTYVETAQYIEVGTVALRATATGLDSLHGISVGQLNLHFTIKAHNCSERPKKVWSATAIDQWEVEEAQSWRYSPTELASWEVEEQRKYSLTATDRWDIGMAEAGVVHVCGDSELVGV